MVNKSLSLCMNKTLNFKYDFIASIIKYKNTVFEYLMHSTAKFLRLNKGRYRSFPPFQNLSVIDILF